MSKMTINISDYNRPGIFINEINDSVRQVPAQTELISLVTGFSRKGPVNKPVLISTPQELYNIFGDIDRYLEKKGAFFHRTILSILNSSPVWAVNLLKTDTDLDLLDWKSISTSSNLNNTPVVKSSYEDFFDKSDFWERDTDAFLAVADEKRVDENHILHVTNMSNKKVSVFIHKSSASGYDDTLDIYYGSVDQVPAYLNSKDQAKDYLVSMLIVAGDWSDYSTLSVDTRWSKYFNINGLRKTQISNFRNDKAVNVLGYYADLSLVPYFKDLNGRDIFIETVVNRDTDTHGVFLSYDIDRVENNDFRNGMLDLIGSNLVGDNLSSIDYLSYKETISEKLNYETIVLDRAGNSFGKELEFETYKDGTQVINQVVGTGFTELTLSGLNYYNLNGEKVTPDADNNTVTVPNSNIGKIRKDTVYVDQNGALGWIQGFEVSNQTLWDNVPLKPVTEEMLPIAVVGVGEQANSGSSAGLSIEYVENIENLVWGLGSSAGAVIHDIAITYNGVNEEVFTFAGTLSSSEDTLYRKTLLNKLFNVMQSNLISGVSIIKDSTDKKIVLNNITIADSSDADKSLTVNVAPSVNINNGDASEVYFIDDEQTFVPSTGSTTYGLKTDTSASTAGYGICSVNSPIYKAYMDGVINSGDFFYPSLFSIKISKADFYSNAGNSIIRLWYNSGELDYTKLSVNRQINITGTTGNNKIFTILSNSGETTGLSGDYDTYAEIIVNESVSTESLTGSEITVGGASETDKRYLKMYFIGSELTIEFTQDETLIGINPIDFVTDFDMSYIDVYSNKSNFKQSVEIETIIENNEVLVSAERYGEVKIGDYLQAYVNESNLEAGEVPKRLTRIIGKELYGADPTLIVLKTDAAIDVIKFGDDAQTFRYTSVEDYVNTYSAITLGGFKIREASMPDGTETRQSSILDMIAVGTPLFKGLVNRNKISWRYLIDSWGMGLTSNSKQQLVDLCGERLTAFGIISMPSAKQFKKSQSPSFIDSDNKTLRTDFIREGADPDSNPAFRYTLGSGKGQSNVGYFFPYCTISDNNRPIDVPPAMFVANTFLRKHISRLASVKPWTPAAGVNNGIVQGIGNIEMDFTPDDITNLNLMGVNPIVYKMNRGFAIETNNTSEITPKSSLSYITSREVLIELENEMYQMLLTYQWRENTPEVREEIKTKADNICERFKREKGLYDFRNVMNETNNTDPIIDAQIGVIDTYVEVVKNMAVLVNNVTIFETGRIQSEGFTQA